MREVLAYALDSWPEVVTGAEGLLAELEVLGSSVRAHRPGP